MVRNDITIALAGFGEVGTTLARDFAAAGAYSLRVYDILIDNAVHAAALDATARTIGAACCRSFAEAAQDARIVISAVTASSSTDVAQRAGEILRSGQIFLDLNSVSPRTKRMNAQAVERSGARYVEAAVMAPIQPAGIATPMLLGGTAAHELCELLSPAGMKLEVLSQDIGRASAVKMCRSIMIKGLEALTVECLLTARMYGVEDHIVASLDRSYPDMRWEQLAGYLVHRVMQHGRRRAAEMREVAVTIEETGLPPLMASATAARQDSVADLVDAAAELKSCEQEEWRTTLDQLATLAGLRRMDGE